MNCLTRRTMKHAIRYAMLVFLVFCIAITAAAQTTILQNVNIVDGTGNPIQTNKNLVIKDGIIAAIATGQQMPKDATVVNLQGKTIMPAIISVHNHIGTLQGTTANGANYKRENILSQLNKYESYGVSAISCMGTDRPLIFNGFRDSSVAGLIPGARLYSAGFGFGVPGGGPPVAMGMDKVFRPATPNDVVKEMDTLAALKPTVVKMWVMILVGNCPR